MQRIADAAEATAAAAKSEAMQARGKANVFSNSTTPHCKILQHPATPCNTLQHPTTPCNNLEHTATRCNTL